jgi:hypothetical protein
MRLVSYLLKSQLGCCSPRPETSLHHGCFRYFLDTFGPSVFHRGRLTFRPERHKIRSTVPWRGVSNSELCCVSLCEPLETNYLNLRFGVQIQEEPR